MTNLPLRFWHRHPLPQPPQDVPPPDLLGLSLELTVYGVFLAFIMPLTFRRVDAAGITTICLFLACVFFYRIFFSPGLVHEYLLGRVISIACCLVFIWWLVHQAEATRIGWYRSHVLQQRVQQLIGRAPAYIVLADETGKVTKTSDNIQSLTGWSQHEIIGKHIHMFMRPAPARRHDVAFAKAVEYLRGQGDTPNAGWMLQGVLTVGVVHRDGHIVPVRAYAGGIRWSQNVQFEGDVDMFAVLVPVTEEEARGGQTTIPPGTPIQIAPPPPVFPPVP